jgi:hypothetical protein
MNIREIIMKKIKFTNRLKTIRWSGQVYKLKRLLSALFFLVVMTWVGNAMAVIVTTTGDGDTLASTILGSGITISNVTYTGASVAAGTFTDGASSGIGIDSGIILTSGDASLADNNNDDDGSTGNNGLPGDSDLNALIPQITNDATVLEFDFVTAGGDLFFSYVFASEEYNEYVGEFNDVFAFFLDGVNIALLPGTNMPVSVDNVNCGNPFVDDGVCSILYKNNDLDDGGPFFNFEYDGFTFIFTAQGLNIGPGTHHIKLAIADADDFILDSAVFIGAGSFSDVPVSLRIKTEDLPSMPVGTEYSVILEAEGGIPSYNNWDIIHVKASDALIADFQGTQGELQAILDDLDIDFDTGELTWTLPQINEGPQYNIEFIVKVEDSVGATAVAFFRYTDPDIAGGGSSVGGGAGGCFIATAA